MPTLRRPNLEADHGATGKAFVTVQAEHQSLGISKSAMQSMGASHGEYLHLAFDQTWRPYVGAVENQTPQSEPEITDNNSSTQCYSTLLCRQLVNVLDWAPDEGSSIRFQFAGETIQDEKTGATLHRLEVPEV